MKASKLRNWTTRFILISNSLLILSLFIFYFARGLDEEELGFLVSLLIPITTVYIGTLVKYAIDNQHTTTKQKEENDKEVNKMYVLITKWAIPAHVGILFFAIAAYATFNMFSFSVLKVIFTAVEGFFGTYIGLIVTSLFQVKKE